MNEDSYSRAAIKTVEEMTAALHQVRADVNRAINPLYQRITEVERRQREDSQAREERQRSLDERLTALHCLVEQQTARGAWRSRLEVAIGLGTVVVIVLLLVLR
jgi:hypothetical protein